MCSTKVRSHFYVPVTFLLLAIACGGDSTETQFAPTESVGRSPEAFWGTVEGAIKVCPAGPVTYGLDVSKWQGKIDWAKVAATDVKFVITRIAHGTGHDAYFEENWAAIKAYGMVRGAYQFYAPLQDAKAQAEHVIQSVGMLGPGDLPVTLDVEWTDGTPNAKEIQIWVDLVTQGTGKRPMIYTAVGYWNQYFKNEFKDLDLWVANWETNCPSIPNGWDNWLFWQTSGGGGTVPGVNGGVDENLFNGTLEELKFVAGLPTNTNCSAIGSLNCSKYGCFCADNGCSGGFCEGSGCSQKTIGDCAAFGCGCTDGVCDGGTCPGTGCTAKEITDCGNFGCNCVDHQCSGGFCDKSGCTYKEETECAAKGCGCVDHTCSGGNCEGSGCTAKQSANCEDSGQKCVLGSCQIEEIPDEDAGTGSNDAGGSDDAGAVDTGGSQDMGVDDMVADPVDAGNDPVGDSGGQDVVPVTDLAGSDSVDNADVGDNGKPFVIPTHDTGVGTDTGADTTGQGGIPPVGGQSLTDGNDDGGCSTGTGTRAGLWTWWLLVLGAVWTRRRRG